MMPCKRLPFVMLSTLYATFAGASPAGEALGAEALAMGGAAAASPGDNSALTLNPAVIGLAERYDLHATFRYGPSAGIHWGGSLVDSRTSQHLAAGLSYTGTRFEGPLVPGEQAGWTLPGVPVANRKRMHDVTFALAVPLLERRLSVGVNGNVSRYDHDRFGEGTWFNTDVGLAARPVDWLVISAAGRNLLPLDHFGDRPLAVLGAVRVEDADIGALELDVEWVDLEADRRIGWAAGAAKTLGKSAVLRAGFRDDVLRERRDVTFGFGLKGGGASISWGAAVPLGMGTDTLRGMVNQVGITFDMPDPHRLDGFD